MTQKKKNNKTEPRNETRMAKTVYSDNLAWLCAALSKEETRYIMLGFLAETGADGIRRLIATDGRRLHIMKASGSELDHIPDGIWKPIFGKKATGQEVMLDRIDGNFPAWTKCMIAPEVFISVRAQTHKSESAKHHGLLFDVYSLGIPINTQYLLDMEKAQFIDTWKLGLQKGVNTVHFAVENLEALIMPLGEEIDALMKAAYERIERITKKEKPETKAAEPEQTGETDGAERETETENGMDEQTEAVPEAEVYFDYDIADEDDELSGTQLATEEPKPQTGGAEREIDGYSAWLKSVIDDAA